MTSSPSPPRLQLLTFLPSLQLVKSSGFAQPEVSCQWLLLNCSSCNTEWILPKDAFFPPFFLVSPPHFPRCDTLPLWLHAWLWGFHYCGFKWRMFIREKGGRSVYMLERVGWWGGRQLDLLSGLSISPNDRLWEERERAGKKRGWKKKWWRPQADTEGDFHDSHLERQKKKFPLY